MRLVCSEPDCKASVVYTTLQLCKKHYDQTSARRQAKIERNRTPAHQAYLRNWAYVHQHGITAEDVERLLESQDGRCAICGTDKPGGKGSFHLDHDHATNKVRGLLCAKCNLGLGYFDDNRLNVLRAALYLEKFS